MGSASFFLAVRFLFLGEDGEGGKEGEKNKGLFSNQMQMKMTHEILKTVSLLTMNIFMQ